MLRVAHAEAQRGGARRRVDVGGGGVDAARERRLGQRVGDESRLAARLDARHVGLRQVGDDPGLLGSQATALGGAAEGGERLLGARRLRRGGGRVGARRFELLQRGDGAARELLQPPHLLHGERALGLRLRELRARVAHLGRLLLGRDRAEGAQEIAHRLGAHQRGLDAGHARLARPLRALGPLLGLGPPAGEREPEQHGEKVSHGAAPAASITSASASWRSSHASIAPARTWRRRSSCTSTSASER